MREALNLFFLLIYLLCHSSEFYCFTRPLVKLRWSKGFTTFFFSKSSQIQINSLTSHVHLFGSKLPRCPPYLSQWCIELRLFLLTFCIFIGEREREKRNKEVNSEEKSDKVRRIEIKDDRMGERWIKGMLKKAKNTEKDRKR